MTTVLARPDFPIADLPKRWLDFDIFIPERRLSADQRNKRRLKAARLAQVSPLQHDAYLAALRGPLRRGRTGWFDCDSKMHHFGAVYYAARRRLLIIDGAEARAAEAVQL
jgi:hypothetical protein